MHRFATTWKLARASWQVLLHDKELAVLPLLSGLVTAAVAATFVIPLVVTDSLGGPAAYVVLAVFYAVTAYITVFFNTALVHAADERLDGGDPSLRSALAGAASLAGRILPWALLSATVSLVLRAVEERAGFLGRLVAGLAGLAWSLVTFLVLPVLVVEGGGVTDAVKRSASLFRDTWGENMIANVGFGLLGALAMVPAALLVALGVLAGSAGAVAGAIAAVVWVVAVVVVTSALSGIFQTALYHYAVRGRAPGPHFSTADLAGAFRPR